MVIKRGDVVVVAISGDYGKPRPAIVVQSDSFHDHPSVTIVPVTSTLTDTPPLSHRAGADAAKRLA